MQSESAISVSPHPYQERNVVTQNTLILFGVLRVFNEKINCILGCILKASCTMMMLCVVVKNLSNIFGLKNLGQCFLLVWLLFLLKYSSISSQICLLHDAVLVQWVRLLLGYALFFVVALSLFKDILW